MQRILGIDPGSRKTGWGIIDYCVQTRRMLHVAHGTLHLDVGQDHCERIGELSVRLHEVFRLYSPAVVAIEDVFVSKNARSALILGQARGSVLAICGLFEVYVASHSPTKVKMTITGKGRAEKGQVAKMVVGLLGLKKMPAEDAADALAVAICQAMMAHALPLAADKPRARKTSVRKSLQELARQQGKL